MRLAQINLPLNFNNGTPALAAHAYLETELATVFGGFTSWVANGAWIDAGKLYAEPVKVYQIAFDPESTAGKYGAIQILAKQAARFADQIAVFYVIDGEAIIENCI